MDVVIAAKYLHKFCENSDLVQIKYEVRCLDCFEVIEVYDSPSEIILDSSIKGYCGHKNDITLDNIYREYYILEEGRTHLIDKQRSK